MTKTKQYALPILAIIAVIAVMAIPSAQAWMPGDDEKSIEYLEQAIAKSQGKIATLQAAVASERLIVEHRVASIATLQVTIDTLDAIVASGGVLTHDQIVLYNDSVAEIAHLEYRNLVSNSKISSYTGQIRSHQAIIATVQAIIDAR